MTYLSPVDAGKRDIYVQICEAKGMYELVSWLKGLPTRKPREAKGAEQ